MEKKNLNIEKTPWAKQYKEEYPDGYRDLVSLMSRSNKVELHQNNPNLLGVWEWFLVSHLDSKFWLRVFDTRKKARAFCKKVGWEIVRVITYRERERKSKGSGISLIEGEVAIPIFPKWVTDRDPHNKEMVWNKEYKYFENVFLVSRDGHVYIIRFISYPKVKKALYGKATSKKWAGYWDHIAKKPDGWMPLPEPVSVKQKDKGK